MLSRELLNPLHDFFTFYAIPALSIEKIYEDPQMERQFLTAVIEFEPVAKHFINNFSGLNSLRSEIQKFLSDMVYFSEHVNDCDKAKRDCDRNILSSLQRIRQKTFKAFRKLPADIRQVNIESLGDISPVLRLPAEIQLTFFRNLSVKERLVAGQVCFAWQRLINDNLTHNQWLKQLGFDNKESLITFTQAIKQTWLKNLFLQGKINREQVQKVTSLLLIDERKRKYHHFVGAGLITEEQAQQIRPLFHNFTFSKPFLMSNKGIRALLEGLITPEQILQLKSDWVLYPYRNFGCGFQALLEGLVTMADAMEVKNTACLTTLFRSESNLQALRDGRISLSLVKQIRNDLSLDYLLTENGLKALKQGFITEDQVIEMESSALYVTDGNWLCQFVSENGYLALIKGWLHPNDLLHTKNSLYAECLLSDAGIKALSEGWLTPQKACQLSIFKLEKLLKLSQSDLTEDVYQQRLFKTHNQSLVDSYNRMFSTTRFELDRRRLKTASTACFNSLLIA